MDFFLAGDLGGTKTVFALYAAGSAMGEPLCRRRYASGDHENFSAMLAEFLQACPESPSLAVLGVAGPVAEGTARITNLGWFVDQAALRQEFGFTKVILLNDLVAVARAVPALAPDDFFIVNAGRSAPRGSVAVIAPGTGLGEACLHWCGADYRAFPSEGGHCDFAPVKEEEQALLDFLRPGPGHVSYETVCSGLGIPVIHRFITEAGRVAAEPALRAELAEAADPTPVILRHALEHGCPAARRTVELFLAILAAEAGNAALKFLATGGVVLGGGLLPRLLPLFSPERFMARFAAKGRMAELLAAVPVKIILREDAALLGAALTADSGEY